MYIPDTSLRSRFASAGFCGRQICLYRNISVDPIFSSFVNLIDLLSKDGVSSQSLIENYFGLVSLLAGIEVPDHFKGDTWQYHLIHLILSDDNPFTRTSEITPFENMDSSLRKMAAFDMRNLQNLARIESKNFRYYLKQRVAEHDSARVEIPYLDQWPGWDRPTAEPTAKPEQLNRELTMANDLLGADDWADKVPVLASYHAKNGAGIYGEYLTFKWSVSGNSGYLEGIEEPDPITFEGLFGYRNERKIIIENTEKHLKGLPANNILLYGERGTGKSSTVKALVHKYGNDGLRIVEVPKQYLSYFPQIIQSLRKRSQKFIIFVDDLSFEENDTEYKYLKAVLEGGLESRPRNILIYATSNRRHLIKERFSDRESVTIQDEISIRDSMQEKLSLADRFGITVTFTSPAQAEYLSIVENLTRQAGINVPKDELHRLALQWEIRYNGRSGRTAKQFVDWLAGEKKINRF